MQLGLSICLAPTAEDLIELRNEYDSSGFDLVDLANLFRFIVKH